MVSNHELLEHLFYLDWLIHHLHCSAGEDKDKLDFSRGQGRVLSVLLMEDSISTKRLSEITAFNISSLNEILSKLERKGLIERKPFEKDRRIIINTLTEKAKTCRPEVDLSFFNCLDPEKKDEFNAILLELSGEIEKQINQLNNQELTRHYINKKKSMRLFLDHKKEESHPGGANA